MTHLFKLQSEQIDLFIRNISETKIIYTIHSKEGKLMQPIIETEYHIKEDNNVYFGEVSIPLNYFDHIKLILN
jgi:hypothetical protein